ncbi:MAG: hypothetical protein WBB52_13985 [Acidimicrobiales bacterium]
MRCEEVTDVLPGLIDGSADLTQAEHHHVAECLRCQAELVQYRKLVRGLRLLRSDLGALPDGLSDNILVYLAEASERSAVRAILTGRRAAYLGGIAATAAGAGAAFVLARRGRLPLAG